MRLIYNSSRLFSVPLIIIILSIFLLISWKPLHAHSPGQSAVYLQIFDNKISGRFEVTLGDLNKSLGHSSTEELITEENLVNRLAEIHDYLLANMHFYDDTGNLPVRFNKGFDLMRLNFGTFAQLDFVLIEDRPPPAFIDIDYSMIFDSDPDHRGYLVIEQYWRANIFNNEGQISLTFSPDDRRQQLDIANYSILNGLKGIIKLGIKHIWKGIDHILFLIALLLPATMFRRENNWRPVTEFKPAFFYVVKIVTLFTIAHSITLSLAAFNIIELPTRLVESLIALSIAIAALDILFPVFHRKIGWVVFLFGLFHGFGFASVLSHLGVLGEHMALSLFGFNFGVEIGQVAVISLVFPILYWVRNYVFFPKIVLRYGSIALMLLGLAWFVDRAIWDLPVMKLVKNSLAYFIS